MYLKALNSGLFSSMRSMCSAVGADPGSVSKLVALAKLPSDVLAAFQSPLDIQYQWGALLGAALQKDPDLVLARAKTFCYAEPSSECSGGFQVSGRRSFGKRFEWQWLDDRL
jgi:ParB family chromosome partitioning protein